MSRDWTPEELQAASAAMKAADQMSYEEFAAELDAKEKIARFAKRQRDYNFPCPRCGRWAMDADPVRNAQSRRVDVYICDACGIEEALEGFAGQRQSLASWNIAQHDEWPILP